MRHARATSRGARARLDGREAILARAQLVLAREHGYRELAGAGRGRSRRTPRSFVLAATDRQRTRAEADARAARPGDRARTRGPRLVLGRGWDRRPERSRAGRAAGRRCSTSAIRCFASAALARELLARGADPNASFVNEYGRDVGALRRGQACAHDPELTRVLLEAGANPDDGESLYHATEAPDPDCLRLLLEHGAHTERTRTRSPHALDDERLEHVRLLLEAGADRERAGVPRPRRAARPRARGPRACSPTTAPTLDRAGRRDLARERAAAHALPARRAARARGRGRGAGRARRRRRDVDPADEAVAAIARGERPARRSRRASSTPIRRRC